MIARFAAALVCLLFAISSHAAGDKERPNIVFILADDLGWSELGCYGNGFNETPHLDHLARDGVRFTQAYAAAPVCSPYRASLLTGQHPARLGIVDYLRPSSANALSTEQITLPQHLRTHGYRTGMIGKWHLTGYEHHGAEHDTGDAPLDRAPGVAVQRRLADLTSELGVAVVEVLLDLLENALFVFGERHFAKPFASGP